MALQFLDLSNNHLSDEIPEFLSNFRILQYLNLSYNNFFGMVPSKGILTMQVLLQLRATIYFVGAFLLETNQNSTNQSSSFGVRGTVGYAPPGIQSISFLVSASLFSINVHLNAL